MVQHPTVLCLFSGPILMLSELQIQLTAELDFLRSNRFFSIKLRRGPENAGHEGERSNSKQSS